jgi:hypothetical protein
MSRAKAGAGRAFAAMLASWIGGTLSVPAQGAQWQFDPRVGFGGTYDDNYLLGSTAQNTFSVYGARLDASLQLTRTTPTTTILFTPRLRSSYFPSHHEDDANDQFAFFSFDRQGQTSDAGVKVDYRRQTLLKQNLPDTDVNTGLGQPSRGTDIGVLFSRARQTLLLVDPHGQLVLTPRQSLELKGEFLDANYSYSSQQVRQDYLPYKNALASLAYQFALSLRNTLIVRGTGSKFLPGQGGDSMTYGVEGEWSTRVTEKAQYYVRAGIQHTQFDANTAIGTPARNANSFAGGAGVNWSFQVTTVFVDAIRSVSPSSQGFALLQDLLRVRVEHRVTPRLADFVGITGIKNQSLGNASTDLSDRRYIAAITGLEWRMYREWSLTGTYSYTWQRYVNQQTTAHSNAIGISVIYEPHRAENGRAITIGY